MSIFGFNKFDINGKNNIIAAVVDDKLFKLGRQEIRKLGKIKIHGNNNRIYVAVTRTLGDLYLFYWNETTYSNKIDTMSKILNNRKLLEWR